MFFRRTTVNVSFKAKVIYFLVTTIAILAADLAVNIINKYVILLEARFNPHLVTLIGMGVVLILFYLLITFIDTLSEMLVKKIIYFGRIYFGRNIGLILASLFLFVIMYIGYYWVWFDKFILSEFRLYLKSIL